MYVVEIIEKENFWGAPCYRTESELIEADGEAEELFLNQCVDFQSVESIFYAIDDRSEEQIELDITEYISSSAFDLMEKTVSHIEGEISYERFKSIYLACKGTKHGVRI